MDLRQQTELEEGPGVSRLDFQADHLAASPAQVSTLLHRDPVAPEAASDHLYCRWSIGTLLSRLLMFSYRIPTISSANFSKLLVVGWGAGPLLSSIWT